MPEMKVSIKGNIGAGMDITAEFTRVVDTEEEAREAGEEDRGLFDAYMEGYGGGQT